MGEGRQEGAYYADSLAKSFKLNTTISASQQTREGRKKGVYMELIQKAKKLEGKHREESQEMCKLLENIGQVTQIDKLNVSVPRASDFCL